MAASLSGLSASVTRILYLTGFPKELKTKDIHQAFTEYDSMSGGFKIKWRDDTSLMIVFQDAAIGACLSTQNVITSLFIGSNSQARLSPYLGLSPRRSDLHQRCVGYHSALRRSGRPSHNSKRQRP